MRGYANDSLPSLCGPGYLASKISPCKIFRVGLLYSQLLFRTNLVLYYYSIVLRDISEPMVVGSMIISWHITLPCQR